MASGPDQAGVGRVLVMGRGRMHAAVPDAKLIYILRDPVDRAVSHYVHHISHGRETRGVRRALNGGQSDYLLTSRYDLQLEVYRKWYPAENILVLSAEDLKDRRREALARVFGFLGVDDEFTSEAHARMLHRSEEKTRRTAVGRLVADSALLRRVRPLVPGALARFGRSLYRRRVERPTLSERHEKELIAYFKEPMQRLRAETGGAFPHWRV